jgi:hypothetical protein
MDQFFEWIGKVQAIREFREKSWRSDNISGLDAYSMCKSMVSIWVRSLSEFQNSGVFVFQACFKSPLVNEIRAIGKQSTAPRPALRGYWLTWTCSSQPKVFLSFSYRNWEEKCLSATFTTISEYLLDWFNRDCSSSSTLAIWSIISTASRLRS